MFAAAFHAHLDLATEEGLGEGGALGASKGGKITGACEPHGLRKGTIHRGGWRARAFRVREDMEV